jgi:hypothetical protein
MAYDWNRGRTVLFGGSQGSVHHGDTWEWDGANWHQRQPAHSPSSRALHGMAYDPARNRVVLFGGSNFARIDGDTWEWDGTDWTQATSTVGPGPRWGHAITYDASRGATIVHGGSNGALVNGQLVVLDDAWAFDGATWTPVAVVGSRVSRLKHGMAYDFVRRRTLVVGGDPDGDSWLLLPPDPESLAFGRGCAGSGGVPSLTVAAGSSVGLGGTCVLRLGALPLVAGVALFVFGVDLVQWNGQSLPISLAHLGLAGCDLAIGLTGAVLVPVAHGGMAAAYGLPIPAAPALRGLDLGAQALVVDAAAPSGTGAVTNGLLLRIR